MAQNKGNEIHFVQSSSPGHRSVAGSQRQAHAHAARVAHAKRRRHFRVIEYDKGVKPQEHDKESKKPAKSNDGPGKTSASMASPPVKAEHVAVSSLVDLLSSCRRDPFSGFARSFNQEEYFLLDYYTQVVLPFQSFYCHPHLKQTRYLQLMKQEWTPLIITRGDALNSMFLAACRDLCAHQQKPERQQYYKQLALRYKITCMRDLNKAISVESTSIISEVTLATVMMLASDEKNLGDLNTCERHILGMFQMIKRNGGPQTLGLNGFMKQIIFMVWDYIHLIRPEFGSSAHDEFERWNTN